MTAGVGTIHSQWAQRPLRQMDVENWQLKDKQYQWSGHWVDNLMTFFSLQWATPILGIQVFIHYRWCRKQGSHDASEKISPSVEDASHFPSSCKNLLHPPLPEWFSPPPNSKSLYFRASHLPITYRQFCNRSPVTLFNYHMVWRQRNSDCLRANLVPSPLHVAALLNLVMTWPGGYWWLCFTGEEIEVQRG